MIILHAFAPVLFLLSRGIEPLSIERNDNGIVEYVFSDASRPALHEYSTLKRRLNEIIEAAGITTTQR
jgi:hypothetical protein